MIRYLVLILSMLMVSCLSYRSYEREAVTATKKTVGCKEYLVATANLHDNGATVKIKACDKYYTWSCNSNGGCGPIKCKLIAVESRPMKDVRKTQ